VEPWSTEACRDTPRSASPLTGKLYIALRFFFLPASLEPPLTHRFAARTADGERNFSKNWKQVSPGSMKKVNDLPLEQMRRICIPT